MARRFAGPWAVHEGRFWTAMGGDPDPGFEANIREFQPTWVESNWIKYRSFPKKPSRIFVNSMSDIAFWKRKWMHEVIDVIKMFPQHTFIFLTKDPYCYPKYNFPKNCWLGATATTAGEVAERGEKLGNMNCWARVFMSIEPIMERIPRNIIKKLDIDWLIVGAETGIRKGKVVPDPAWIREILHGTSGIPAVFLKNNLRAIYPEIVQEFPEARA